MALQKVSPVPFVGLGLHACTMFLVGASVLFLPGWLVAVTGPVWAVCALLGVLSFSLRPARVLPFAVVALAVWVIAVVGYALI